MMEEVLQLGGNIELAGFGVLNNGEMIIVKKIVGNYARRMEEVCTNFSGLKLKLKPLHQAGDKIRNFELHAQVVDDGKVIPAGVTEHNLFVGVDSVCKKLVNEIAG